MQGPLRLAPLGAELRARVTQLDPAVLMSYVDLPVSLAGVVESDLTVDVAYSGTLTARVRGRTAVSRATVTDGGRQVASARRIEVDGIEVDSVDSRSPRIGVARVRVIQPTAIVERDQAGRIPLADRFAPAPASPGRGAAAKTAPAPSGLSVAVAEIVVDDGAMTLDDAAAVPPARLTLAKLRGSARNVEWPPRGRVSIDLQARHARGRDDRSQGHGFAGPPPPGRARAPGRGRAGSLPGLRPPPRANPGIRRRRRCRCRHARPQGGGHRQRDGGAQQPVDGRRRPPGPESFARRDHGAGLTRGRRRSRSIDCASGDRA